MLIYRITKLYIYKTPLYYAVENGEKEIVELLLSSEKIDINLASIHNSFFTSSLESSFQIKFLIIYFFIPFKTVYFNYITKLNNLIAFLINHFNLVLAIYFYVVFNAFFLIKFKCFYFKQDFKSFFNEI